MSVSILKKTPISQFIIGVLGLTIIPFAYAETGKAPLKKNKVIKDSVVVSETKSEIHVDDYNTPYLQTTIDATAPQNQMATSVKDLLHNIPGVEIKGTARSNGQNINMRGFNENGVLLKIDDVSLNNSAGNLGGYFIDPAIIKQITVIKGGNSTRYGTGALGGVILFNTLNAKDLLRPNETVGARVVTHSDSVHRSNAIGLTTYGATEQLDGLFSVNYRHNKDIRLAVGESEANRDNIHSLLAKGSWQPKDGFTLSTKARVYHNDAAQPPGIGAHFNPKANLAKRRTHTEDYQLNASISPENISWLKGDILAYTSKTKIDQYGSPRENNTQQYETKGIRVENQQKLFNYSAASLNVFYGGEHIKNDNNTDGKILNTPKSSSHLSSGWLSGDLSITPASLVISSGIRYSRYNSKYKGDFNKDNTDSNDKAWSPSVAMTYEPIDWLMLFGSYSRSFRAPTSQELFRDGPHGAGRFLPNAELRPEYAKTKEVGLGLNFNSLLPTEHQLTLKTSYFDIKSKDYLNSNVTEKYFLINGKNTRAISIQTINIPTAHIWGVDSTANYTNPYFTFSLGYNLTQGKDRSVDGWLPTFGPQKVTTQISVPIKEQLTLGWNAVYACSFDKYKKETITPPSYKAPEKRGGYAVHGLFAYWQSQGTSNNFSIGAAVDNVFNKEYFSSTGILQDGRNVKLHLGYQW